ncbi:MAG: aminotransferase class IV [Armatimonadota bacterium]|nr:aminotransferase class IV [Armatimonadota bacterium]MDR7444669.1 aminotransferase class IV [Armatimonadota bacterium]MDR7571052.1 aminotransferase class IV [Armatimonadota bacterium]MDR7613622.1 aminotransferase class IV [Armatimonadota bacterium]
MEARRAWIPATDRGFLLGDGLFETTRVYRGRAPLLAYHLRRLHAGAERLGIPIPWDLGSAAAELLRHVPAEHGVLRITLTRGPGPRGYDPPATAHPTALLQVDPLEAAAEPVDAWLSSLRRDPRAPTAGLKTTSALPLVLARQEARAAGCGEALLLDTEGNLAEGTATNLFWVREGILYTPALATGCLPGIARALVLELSRVHGIPVREVTAPVEALEGASEAFLTNAVRLLLPLRSVRLPGGARISLPAGPLTETFRAALWNRFVEG